MEPISIFQEKFKSCWQNLMNFSQRTQPSRLNQIFSAGNYCNFLQDLNIFMYTKVEEMKFYKSCDLFSSEYWAVAIRQSEPSGCAIPEMKLEHIVNC